jgi:uncharacterized membrane protein
VGRRWGFLGVIVFFLSLLWFIGMVLFGLWALESYSAELETAYPTVRLFTSDAEIDEATLDADRVNQAESGALAYAILFALSLLGVVMGLTLTLVGYLHNKAYNVSVPPLPT